MTSDTPSFMKLNAILLLIIVIVAHNRKATGESTPDPTGVNETMPGRNRQPSSPATAPATSQPDTSISPPASPPVAPIVEIDHTLLDRLLRTHVRAGGYVDYASIKSNPEALNQYIRSLESVDIELLGRDERLAFLLNAYNAFTLKLIIERYPIRSIMDLPESERWDRIRWRIGDDLFSLNQIEHVLIRPYFNDPRIHFALVCAAIGCPPLRPEAYQARSLENQLADQTVLVHSNPRWVQVDQQRGDVALTVLYSWYEQDFEIDGSTALQYAAKHTPALAELLREGRSPKLRYLDYDWTLNDIAKLPANQVQTTPPATPASP